MDGQESMAEAAGATPAGSARPSTAELRAFLRERLPDFMVPAQCVWLDELPRTPNGKVDRSRLPEPAAAQRTRGPRPPRTPTERALAEVWAEVLGIERIDVDENFFDLGGNSISVIWAVDRANRRGLPVSAAQLFQHQTISRLAAAVGQPATGSPPATADSLVAIKPAGTRPPLFLLHSSTGSAVPYLHLAQSLHPDQPGYGIQVAATDGDLDSIERLARRHATVIRELCPAGPYHLAGWSLGGALAWAVASLLQQDGGTVGMLALLDTQPPTQLPEPVDQPTAISAFVDSYAMSLGRAPIGMSPDTLRAAAPDERYPLALRQLEHAGLVGSAERDHVLGTARMAVALTRAASTWRPAGYHGRLDLLVAEESGRTEDFARGWRRHGGGAPVQTHPVPGDHFTMLRQPHLGKLAATLQTLLDDANRRIGSDQRDSRQPVPARPTKER